MRVVQFFRGFAISFVSLLPSETDSIGGQGSRPLEALGCWTYVQVVKSISGETTVNGKDTGGTFLAANNVVNS